MRKGLMKRLAAVSLATAMATLVGIGLAPAAHAGEYVDSSFLNGSSVPVGLEVHDSIEEDDGLTGRCVVTGDPQMVDGSGASVGGTTLVSGYGRYGGVATQTQVVCRVFYKSNGVTGSASATRGPQPGSVSTTVSTIGVSIESITNVCLRVIAWLPAGGTAASPWRCSLEAIIPIYDYS